jgi:hypothetical protein
MSMSKSSLRGFLTVILVSFTLVGASEAFAQDDPDPGGVQTRPKDMVMSGDKKPQSGPAQMKTVPSAKGLPVSIPDNQQPSQQQMEKRAPIEASPIAMCHDCLNVDYFLYCRFFDHPPIL